MERFDARAKEIESYKGRILKPLFEAALMKGDAFAWYALLRTRDEAPVSYTHLTLPTKA